MTAFRRFFAMMECPLVIWEVESAREIVWDAVRQRCYRHIRDQGHRPLDGRMVPAAMSEVQVTEYRRTTGHELAVRDGRVTTEAVRVPCDETAADTVLLTLSAWGLPDGNRAPGAGTIAEVAGHER